MNTFVCGASTLHSLFQKADLLSKQVIGAAIEVHRHLGPGLIESIYQKCLLRELELVGLIAVQQRKVAIEYKGLRFEEDLRLDILVEVCLLLKLKVVSEILPVHKAQVITYLKLLDCPLGLLMNFHETRMVEGISRLMLPGANF